MSKKPLQQGSPRAGRFKRYVLGLGIGSAAAIYGLVALLMGKCFLPGLSGNNHMVVGRSGYALATAYLLGGTYLLVRLYLEKRLRQPGKRPPFYALENLLLAGFIVSLIYVLLHVGTVQ